MNEGKSGPEIPLWKLERYLIGELPPAEMARIDKLKAEDPEVAEWLKALQAEHADLKASHPTERMSGAIWNRLESRTGPRVGPPAASRRSLWRGALLVPALAVALMLTLIPNRFTCSDGSPLALGGNSEKEDTRLKGSLPALYLFRKADSGAEALRPGGAVRAGDLIQVQYEAAGRKYGAVFSVDGSGKVTWHLPERGNLSAALSPSGRTALASAFELDEAPGREDFHFVAADRPFPLDSAADAAIKDNAGFSERPQPDSQGNRSKAAMTHTFFALTKDSLK
jgi:hypothetical protein